MLVLPEITMSAPSDVALTTREALSGVFGSISIACWIFLLLPQVIENYRNQSAEAISLVFILIWLLGDVTNLLGAVWAGLVPTLVATAIYYCFVDAVLLSQCMYYRIRSRRQEGKTWLETARESIASHADADRDAAQAVAHVKRQRQQEEHVDDEEQPLLKRTTSNAGHASQSRQDTDAEMTPAQRRFSMNAQMALRRRSSAMNSQHTLSKILHNPEPVRGWRLWLNNAISLLSVFMVGAAGWWLAYQGGIWKPTPLGEVDAPPEEPTAKGAVILGYISAVAYLGARIPQIVKNWREQSCEGLSILFFILSLCGNLFYGAAILFHSTERDYLIKNVPWLLGSLGTMFEDSFIFVQFHLYSSKSSVDDESAIE